MSDQRYLLPRPSSPWYRQISVDRWFSIAAIVASLSAAAFTGWYAYDTHGMRVDAQEAAKKQGEDVKRAREAAEKSADAAQKSAEAASGTVAAMKDLVATGKTQVEDSRRMFEEDQRPYVWFTVEPDYKTKVRPYEMVVCKIIAAASGKTPLAGLHGKFGFSVGQTIVKPEFYEQPGHFTIGPDGKLTITLERWINYPLPGLEAGKTKLFVYGKSTFYGEHNKRHIYHDTLCVSYPILADGTIQDTGILSCAKEMAKAQ